MLWIFLEFRIGDNIMYQEGTWLGEVCVADCPEDSQGGISSLN